MKNIIFCILITFIIVVTGIILVKNNIKKDIKDNDKCYSISGGGFTIKFNTNSDSNLDSMHVCIACSPDSYLDLPVPTKEGYSFDGWYYDKEFKNKVSGTSTLDVIPSPMYKNENCVIGYNDITLHAKWKNSNND